MDTARKRRLEKARKKVGRNQQILGSLRNKVTKLIDEAKRTYYNNLLTKNANDTSKLWSALKKLLPKKKGIYSGNVVWRILFFK